MALGWSGSNGRVSKKVLDLDNFLLKNPLEVSYFVNNKCNLNCKHCYVGYNQKNGELSFEEWKNVFNDLINLNGLTFGNVGKEPLLSWDKTKRILGFFYEKRKEKQKLRFGFVTNGVLLDEAKIKELSELMPNYIDVSLDGQKEEHDYIRGRGVYDKVVNNLRLVNEINPKLSNKIFISSVLMKHNKNKFKGMINEVSNYGITHFLFSPYVKSEKDKTEELSLDLNEIIEFYKRAIDGELFNSRKDLELILKNDYDTLKPVMDRCAQEKIIDVNNLLIDEYGVIFNKYNSRGGSAIINYIPTSDTFSKEIRISHDGFISNCYAQFFENYPERTEVIGNVKNKSIKEILQTYLIH